MLRSRPKSAHQDCAHKRPTPACTMGCTPAGDPGHRGRVGSPTALALLHHVHHVAGGQSHLGGRGCLVVGNGAVALQDDGARDIWPGRKAGEWGSEWPHPTRQAGHSLSALHLPAQQLSRSEGPGAALPRGPGGVRGAPRTLGGASFVRFPGIWEAEAGGSLR